MYRKLLPLAILLLAAAASAQDVLTIGSGQAASGGSVAIPVFLRDVSGTPLGMDAGSGKRIQGIAFKVLFPTETVSSVTFARSGVTAAPAPLFQSTPTGSGFCSVLLSFSETASPIPFTLNAAPPGDQIGTLTVMLQPTAIAGSTALLTLHPASALLSNQAGTTSESVANGSLALVNGSVTVASTLAAPAALVATAVGTSQVDATWLPAASAHHYEIWRSSHGGASAPAGTSSGTTFSDTNVSAGTTYLYRVRAVDAGGGASPFSNLDPATTMIFTDDPL
ncbi:MAG TPA: fibronectin type III domain-containing protein, partial [Thermoanaerobaculia bacterium]|nr:fibronectin type III domain-containing protein [Thermoanaerobaculia bacterium]